MKRMKPTHNEHRKKALIWLNSAIAYFINSLNFEPVALAAGSDDFIQDDEGVQEMRENPVIIKTHLITMALNVVMAKRRL